MIVVGLTPRHLGPLTPRLSALAREGGMAALDTVTPAVTCSVQASFMTGLTPRKHGIVANGWLFRDQMEVLLWRQSNRLVSGEKIWEAGKKRDPGFTCANMFWWYNMASSHDWGATPRPIYKADGRKLPDCYTVPGQLRERLTERLGPFPLFQFWGPATTIASTRWIAEATKIVMTEHDPTLTLAYLPHLDYDLQRFGPDETQPAVRQSLIDIDTVAGDLANAARASGRSVIVLSEYGITPVDRPVHINRTLRDAGLLMVREEDGGEFLDPAIAAPKAAIGKRLLLRKLGFRALMDVIPLDASLVRGSHGRLTAKAEDGPLVITDQPQLLRRDHIAATDVKQLLLDAIFIDHKSKT